MSRTKERRGAVFAGYQADLTGKALEGLLSGAADFTRELAEGVRSHRDELDDEIARHSHGWSLERIAPLERNIMRVALFEIRHREDVPDEVAIDEAVELAKEYCSADASGFVNGILGAVAREMERA